MHIIHSKNKKRIRPGVKVLILLLCAIIVIGPTAYKKLSGQDIPDGIVGLVALAALICIVAAFHFTRKMYKE